MPHTGASARSGASPSMPTASEVSTSSRIPVVRSSVSQDCSSVNVRSAASCTAAGTEFLGWSGAPDVHCVVFPGRERIWTTTTSAGRNAATSGWPVTSAPAAARPATSSASTSPSSAQRLAAGPAGTGVHSMRNSDSGTVPRSVGSGRSASASTSATSSPVPSASSSAAADPTRLIRTRSAVPPPARNRTPRHENGSIPLPPASTPSTCSAASSSAGCRPYRPASACSGSASATSANSSSPRRQARPTPRNAGPYASPAAASWSYRSSTSSGSAPAGGHRAQVLRPVRSRRDEGARGVPAPRQVAGAGVHADRPATVAVRGPDADLDRDGAVRRQHQRVVQGQIADLGASDLGPGPQGQLGDGRPGQQHGPGHDVVAQPGPGRQREGTGQHGAVAVREGPSRRRAAGDRWRSGRRRWARRGRRRAGR